MKFTRLQKATVSGKSVVAGLLCAASLCAAGASAQVLTSNSTGTHNGFYYSFWKDSGNASFELLGGGRYKSQWDNGTNNWVGGKGWNPGGSKVVSYEGYYGGSNSQNTYLALYGWTRNPLVEYYVIESYGSYNPSSCSGGQNYGSFQSDGGSYDIRRCQRVQQPSIDGTQTFYQYFSVRNPGKGFGNISGTITTGNHFNAWASNGLNLGNHDYMVVATEGYQSSGNSDITVSEGASSGNTGTTTGTTTGNTDYTEDSTPSSTPIVVRARGTAGGEHINLLIGGSVVADWDLTTTAANYSYSGNAGGDVQVEFDNDGGDRDVIVDYVFVNGETRQAEDMEYNTAAYDGECGGGSYSETMNCGGVIGFGGSGNCFSGSCNGTAPSGTTSNTGNTGTDTGTTTGTTNSNCSGYVGLSFDDGPSTNTNALISQLTQNNLTPVTWFNTGETAQNNQNGVRQQLTVGVVQNHSWSHSHMQGWGSQQIREELEGTNSQIQAAGGAAPTLFRPPYGETDSTINSVASSLGMRVITWDVDSRDWDGASSQQIASAAGQLQNGQVILMHDAGYHSNTVNAISQIASNLRAKGLCAGVIDPNTGRAVAPSGSTNTGTTTGTTTGDTGTTTGNTSTSTPSGSDIVVSARGAAGGEHINLLIGGNVVADWNLTTSNANYTYTGNASGSVDVEFDNDGGDRDVILDYVFVNGETRQAEDMEYNTATYDGSCGGGSYSETMHCGGVIGFGETSDCFSGSCNSSAPAGNTDTATNTGTTTNVGTTTNTDTTGSQCECNWWGSLYPVCQNSSGWGWENNQSCISESTCNSQSGDGGVVCS